MSFLQEIFGTKPKLEKVDTMEGGQKDFYNSLMEMLNSGQLGEGYEQSIAQLLEMLDPSEEAMEQFQEPYMRQFNEETIPGLAERFAGMGGGALSSSGFGQALSSAGSGLQSSLASMKSNMQRQALSDIMNQYQTMGQTGLGKDQFAYHQKPAQKGWLEKGAEIYGNITSGGKK